MHVQQSTMSWSVDGLSEPLNTCHCYIHHSERIALAVVSVCVNDALFIYDSFCLFWTGYSEETWSGQLYIIIPHQTCAEDHQIPAAAQGTVCFPGIQCLLWWEDQVWCSVQYSMCAYRSCCPAVKRAKVKLKMDWRSCWVCRREPTTPCMSACWKVQHHWIHTHDHTVVVLSTDMLK